MRSLALISLLALCVASLSVKAQQTISRTNEKVIMESARQAVSDYAKYIELLAQENDKGATSLYKAELMKSVQRDSVNIYNDLIPPEDRPAKASENIDKLTTYLDDINNRYLEGVKIQYSNLVVSKVFIDAIRSRLFVKITADRKIEGVYYNKSQKKQNNNTEKIDFYVMVGIRSTGLPDSKIYSVYIHENNEAQFTPIKVVEQTAPINISNVKRDTTYRRAMEHTVAWTGGEIFESLRIDLYRKTGVGSVKVTSLDTAFVNNNKVRFSLPPKLKTGKRSKYFFQITKLTSEEQPVQSNVFYIKRKIPLIYQVGVPFVIASGVAYLIITSGNDPVVKDPVLPKPGELE